MLVDIPHMDHLGKTNMVHHFEDFEFWIIQHISIDRDGIGLTSWDLYCNFMASWYFPLFSHINSCRRLSIDKQVLVSSHCCTCWLLLGTTKRQETERDRAKQFEIMTYFFTQESLREFLQVGTRYILSKTNIAPEKRVFQKETSIQIPTIHFQVVR